MVNPRVELRDICKSFSTNGQTVEVLAGVSLRAMPGEFVTIIGPSGCGKSTLFNIIVGLLEPDRGEVLLDGQAVQQRMKWVGYMPQRDLLLPWRTVLDNVILALEIAGVPRQEARTEARELLPLFGLENFADYYPAALSGGMRQRTALLRTFLGQKDILLLDEPFGALDALTRAGLQEWLLGVWARFRQTILFVTHDVEEAIFLGDRVYVLSPRPARVKRELSIPLPRPRHRAMVTAPDFAALKWELLAALGD